jgi:hypothetical protein
MILLISHYNPVLEGNHPHRYNLSVGVYVETGSFGKETWEEVSENFLYAICKT